jgi:hypothetical protein
MKISGFTIIRNAVVNDYPVVEAINSILPVVDEMVVLVGNSSDETMQLIRSIDSRKIKIYESTWNDSLRQGGAVLADETNKAFQLIDPASTWAFYIQADEAVHEKDHAAILEACRKHKNNLQVDGLLFKYIHFYGTYDYIGDSRRWYRNEVRIIRNNKAISSYKDAQGFRIGKKKLHVKPAHASVYHYGWVKNPEQMTRKMKEVSKYWFEDSENWRNYIHSGDIFNYDDFDSLERFTGTHPLVMHRRIASKNWDLSIDIKRKNFSFKNRLLYWVEKLTGIRLFDFRNYKTIK